MGAGHRYGIGVLAFGQQTLPLGLANAELLGDIGVGIVSGADFGRIVSGADSGRLISIAHDVPA
jgi:hypothetical protein